MLDRKHMSAGKTPPWDWVDTVAVCAAIALFVTLFATAAMYILKVLS